MSKFYIVYAKNLYAVAGTLVHLRVPFSFSPNNVYKDRSLKSPFRRSTIEFKLEEGYTTISDILFEMNEKYGSNFDFEIITESNGEKSIEVR